MKDAKSKALEHKKEGKKHKHEYHKGKCEVCGKHREENVEYTKEQEGKETGREDGE